MDPAPRHPQAKNTSPPLTASCGSSSCPSTDTPPSAAPPCAPSGRLNPCCPEAQPSEVTLGPASDTASPCLPAGTRGPLTPPGHDNVFDDRQPGTRPGTSSWPPLRQSLTGGDTPQAAARKGGRRRKHRQERAQHECATLTLHCSLLRIVTHTPPPSAFTTRLPPPHFPPRPDTR